MSKKVLIVIAIIVVIAVGLVIFFVTQNSDKVKNLDKEVSVEDENFNVSYLGVDVTPGIPYDRDSIPEEGTYSEIPSCAFEGTDNVSTFSHVEITSAKINGVESVYSVYFLDPEVQTKEGVMISDERSKVIEKYGNDYEEVGNKITYTKGQVQLSFIIENDVVTSIEYVLVVK